MKKAIVIPYRDRKEHLERFLDHYKGWDIFVMEQCDKKPFNRAKLFNVWFHEYGNEYDYFITHDVDMYLDYSKSHSNVYDYPINPTHIATRCEQFNYDMPYNDYFGGVVIFSREQFISVNGFSNEFWSWGGEDDEMRNNVLEKYQIERREAYFHCADHPKFIDEQFYSKNLSLLYGGRSKKDGLNNCEYTLFSETIGSYKHLRVIL